MITFDAIYLSTAYLPPVQYIYYVLHSRKVYIEVQENYVKQTFRNRCEICSANGNLSLSVPVIKVHGNHTKTREILIDYTEKWNISHWRAIESAYNSSPFFIYYKEQFQSIIEKEHLKLIELNLNLLNLIIQILDIDVQIEYTGDFKKEINKHIDLRYKISPKARKTGLILPDYHQVFMEKYGFVENMSIIDLLFNEGPAATDYLKSIRHAKG